MTSEDKEGLRVPICLAALHGLGLGVEDPLDLTGACPSESKSGRLRLDT